MKTLDGTFWQSLVEGMIEKGSYGTADYKASPYAVLEMVDVMLKPFGLEVVLIDSLDDMYRWGIQRIGELG